MRADDCEDQAKTQKRFNQVLKKHTEKEDETVKKKSPETRETFVLQNPKKILNLVKNTENDKAILKNLYDLKQRCSHFDKTQRRETELAQKAYNSSRTQLNLSIPWRSQREMPSFPAPRDQWEANSALDPDEGNDKKHQWKSKKVISEADCEPEASDQLLQEYRNQVETISRTTQGCGASANIKLNSLMWMKKNMLKSVLTVSDRGDWGEGQKSSPKLHASQRSSLRLQNEVEKVSAIEALQEAAVKDGLVLGVLVHRTDDLQTDLRVSHPMVKVHVVDEITGQYVKKKDCHRPVSSFYERESVEHILPIMTQPFDFRKNKSTIPKWQEYIIFNECLNYLNYKSHKVILFFEILDFFCLEEEQANSDFEEHERGFRKIAWAFLKLVGRNEVLNIDRKLRLQLFNCPYRAKRQPNTIEVVEWWRKYPRTKYASTLFVTVKAIKLPKHVDPGVRPVMVLQEERTNTSFSELQQEVSEKNFLVPTGSKQAFRCSRLPGQVCRIPNKAAMAFRGGQQGCFTLLFSHIGTMLAAACADRDTFPIVVYEIPSGKVLATFIGHFRIVYNLCWSQDDSRLLSSSSDGTVREWHVRQLRETARKVLPHPCFVYCAQYHPVAQNLVLTGGYDGLVRVWRLDLDDMNGLLLQEFEAHQSLINTLCFDTEGRRMFSADDAGLIMVWRSAVADGEPPSLWMEEHRVEEAELHGVGVNMLQLHPNGHCLLVHARDSILRVIDLRILGVKKYSGATNQQERIGSTFTPCGSFIFSGSEDGMAYVWNTETGDQVAVYSELCYPTALHGVTFHPHENMVAFCALACRQPIHLYLYDHRVSQLELQSVTVLNRSVSVDSKITQKRFSHDARLSSKMQHVEEQLNSVLEPRGTSSAGGFRSEAETEHFCSAVTTVTTLHAAAFSFSGAAPTKPFGQPSSDNMGSLQAADF